MCTELEIIMLDWVGQMIGLPEQFLCFADPNSKGGGVIQVSSISFHSVCFVGTSISLIFIPGFRAPPATVCWSVYWPPAVPP